jgi:hypothetical protein
MEGNKPNYFLCAEEVTDAERKERKKGYPVRVCSAWVGEKGQINCGRPKVNLVITRNTRLVLFENTAGEEDAEPGTSDDGPF